MASTSRSIYTSEYISSVGKRVSHSFHPVPASPDLEPQELEVLGIRTWQGNAVFTSSSKDPLPSRKPNQSTNSVTDLAEQLIDLTLSPSPPSASISTLCRPRGIARFTSPSARTAYSPSKRRNEAHTADKAVHPFFNQWKKSQAQESSGVRKEQARATSTITKRPGSDGRNVKGKTNAQNPFVSPPVSPVRSTTSIESSPIQPPPASQRPRFAPEDSSPSSSSFASSPSSSISTSIWELQPDQVSPLKQPDFHAQAGTKKTQSPSSKISPLRVIVPAVKKPLNATTVQKTFKPAANLSGKQSASIPNNGSSKSNFSGETSWTFTKPGWTRQRPAKSSVTQNRPPHTIPIAATQRSIRTDQNTTTSDFAEELVMEMQQLDLEREAAGDVLPPSDSYTPSTKPSQPSQPITIPAPAPCPRFGGMFSYKTYHLCNPQHTKPPTIAYTADPQEANELLSMVKGDAIAFDMEWPFSRGRKKVVSHDGKVQWQGFQTQGKTALVQVGDGNLVVLVHLSMMKEFPSKLREIIQDPKTYKLGVNVNGDAQKLVRDYGDIYMKGILDLSYIARAVDAANCRPGNTKIALAKLCLAYTGCELDKGPVRQSNWSKRLSQAQMDYAANDVYSTMVIYNTLLSLGRERGINLNLAGLSSDLSPELYRKGKPVLQTSTGASANSNATLTAGGGGSCKPLAPSKMRAFSFFRDGKSVLEIGQAMRTAENPLLPNTIRGYLLDVVTTSSATLEYDKQRMYDLLSEDVHRCNVQRNKAFLAKLVKQLGKQIPKSPPLGDGQGKLVSSDVEASQEARKATF